MEGGGQTENKCGHKVRGGGDEGAGLEGWAPMGRAPSLRVQVWVCNVWGSGLNVGLWGLGFGGSENLATTLKH